MPGEKAQTKEDMNKNKNKQNQIAKELNKPLESILSYIPKKVRMALSIAIVAGVSLFLPKPAYALDPLSIPSDADSVLTQDVLIENYVVGGGSEAYIDTMNVAFFWKYSDGSVHEIDSTDTVPGYQVQVHDSVYGEDQLDYLKWYIDVKGVIGTPSELRSRFPDDPDPDFHGDTLTNTLWKAIFKTKIDMDLHDTTVTINYYAPDDPDAIDGMSINYTVDPYARGPPEKSRFVILLVDYVTVDIGTILKVKEGDIIKPTNYETGLAYPNPFNSKVTIRTGDNRIGPVRIIDDTGKIIVTSLNGGGNEIIWDASNFKSGKYYAVWKNKNGSYTITDLTLIK